jgi:hydrogenase nickel incorporation protein HypA/HybF
VALGELSGISPLDPKKWTPGILARTSFKEIKMHEMGIALQIVEVAQSSIPPEMKDSRVEKINLKIGKLAAVVSENLNLCMEVAAKDTPLEGAEIHIDEIPVIARCRTCSHQWEVDEAVYMCPECKSIELDIISGNELNVVSIDIGE